jgi:uncharacterized integral membrane protein
MRIIGTLLILALVLVLMLLLSQNLDQYVDVDLFNRSYAHVNLVIVVVASFIAGTIFGVIFMLFQYLESLGRIRQYRKESRDLMDELNTLRNVAIDDLKTQDLSSSD